MIKDLDGRALREPALVASLPEPLRVSAHSGDGQARGDLFGPVETWLPAISMWQPYASLLFVTEPAYQKAHETRGRRYPAKYDGCRIAIQAGLSLPPYVPPALEGLARDAFGGDWRRSLPRGAYIGTVVLSGCHPTENLSWHIGHADRVAGIWDPGRYAWALSDRRAIVPPVSAKGKQGWWKVNASILTGDE